MTGADPEVVFKVLEQLGKGRDMTMAAAVARVDREVAGEIALAHGWPVQHRVRAAWLDLQRDREQAAKGRPLLVLPEPDPVAVARAQAKAKEAKDGRERDAERFTAPDPTAGRIDADICEHVAAMEPVDVGQRVAIENTLQARREVRRPAAVPSAPPVVADPVPVVPDPVPAVPAPRPKPAPPPEPEPEPEPAVAPEPAPVPEPEPGMACGDAVGTERGYQRHYRADQLACPACTAGHATYTREHRPAKAAPEPVPVDLMPVPVVTGNPDEATAADAWFAEGMRPHLPSLITSLDELPGTDPASSPPAPAADLHVADQVDEPDAPAPAGSPVEDEEPEGDPEDSDPDLARALDRFDALRAAGLTDLAASGLAKAPDGVHQLGPGITLTVALDRPPPAPKPAPVAVLVPEPWDGTCDVCGWPVKPEYVERTGHHRHTKCLTAPSTAPSTTT